jgi:hypothetical protein
MVGERYRDVIEAGDSIHSMRDLGNSAITEFTALIALCDVEALERKVGEARKSVVKEDGKKQGMYPVAAQIKLLVDTPEQVWNALEGHGYLVASRLFLVARLIHANLASSKDAVGDIDLKVLLVVLIVE